MVNYRYGDIRVLYNELEDTYNMPQPHFHSEYELYYLFKGERLFFVRDRVYPMVAGCLAFVDGEDMHRAFSSTSLPHSRLVVCLRKGSLQGPLAPLAEPFESGGCLALTAREQFMLEQLYDQLVQECASEHPMKHLQIELLVKQILIFTLRKFQTVTPVPRFGGALMAQAIEHINDNYASEITLQGMCKRLGISPSHFTRLFKASTGFTLIEYVNNMRIKKASELLLSTQRSVSDIAEETGFSSFSYFGKLFRQGHGLSPLQYRKQHAQGGGKRIRLPSMGL